MARLKRIDMAENGITLVVEISREEYKLIGPGKDLLVVPKDDSFLSEDLTSGRLGNSNRIMVPTKLLRNHNVVELPKKVPARIFEVKDQKYLLIRLKRSALIPEFGE